MTALEQPDDHGLRRLRLRYSGSCSRCGIALSRGSQAWHSPVEKVVCLACGPDDGSLAPGGAGASAAAEGNRRKERRVAEVRRKYGDYAAEVAEQLAVAEVASTWGKGSDGERRLAAFISSEVGDRAISLHDRLIPGTKTNIDHIFVAQQGVWVVDSKAYQGKVERREIGPFWRRDHEVIVGGKNRTPLAAGVVKQVMAVKAALAPDPELGGVAIHGALCFVESDWDLLDFPFQVGAIWVMYPGALRKRLKKQGPVSRVVMERVARRLALSLPPAAESPA